MIELVIAELTTTELKDLIAETQQRISDLLTGRVQPRDSNRIIPHEVSDLHYQLQEFYEELEKRDR